MKILEALLESSRAVAIKGQPLRLWQAAAIVTAMSGLVLLYAVEGIHDISAGRKHHALLYCGLAVLMLMTLPIHVYNFLRVKRGVVVPNPWLIFGPLSQSVRVPLSIKVALVGSLTLPVAVASYFSLSLLHASYFHLAFHHRPIARFLAADIAFNLFLWVVVAFAWYLFVVLHKQEAQKVEPTLEQGKEVWPPAPSVPEKSHKDQRKVMINSDDNSYPRPLPQIVSVIVNSILTLFVGLCSAFTIYITYAHFNTQKGWVVCAMSVLSVFAFVGYCWYRVFTEKPVVKSVIVYMPTEGVWPPPPTPPNHD